MDGRWKHLKSKVHQESHDSLSRIFCERTIVFTDRVVINRFMTKPTSSADATSRQSGTQVEQFLTSFNPATRPNAMKAIIVFAALTCQVNRLRVAASIGDKTLGCLSLAVVLLMRTNPVKIAMHNISIANPNPRGERIPQLSPMANKSNAPTEKAETSSILFIRVFIIGHASTTPAQNFTESVSGACGSDGKMPSGQPAGRRRYDFTFSLFVGGCWGCACLPGILRRCGG
jgi:hypothetical protein